MNLIQDYFYETEEQRDIAIVAYEKEGISVDVTDKIVLSPKLFEDELNCGIRSLEQDGMIYSDSISAFGGLVMMRLYDLLELYEKHEHKGAEDAARRMVAILRELESDDDYFPRFEIETICQIVGINEKE